LYDGTRQAIEAKAAKDDIPPLVVTYFTSEENLEKNIDGSTTPPSEIGKYWVRIERPAGNGYKAGRAITVEYYIQNPL
jgi:hypothetical protein